MPPEQSPEPSPADCTLGTVDKLAGDIAHELNNALMPILGLSELLLSYPDMLDDRDSALETLQHIHTAAGEAREAVRRLRQFSTIDSASEEPSTNELAVT